jgi:hypothetical protein
MPHHTTTRTTQRITQSVAEPWPAPGGATGSICMKPEITHGCNAGARALLRLLRVCL